MPNRKKFSELSRSGKYKRLKKSTKNSYQQPSSPQSLNSQTNKSVYQSNEPSTSCPEISQPSTSTNTPQNDEVESRCDEVESRCVLDILDEVVSESDDSDDEFNDTFEGMWEEDVKKNDIKEDIKNWALKFCLSHVALSALLCILRAYGFENLPKDARTLLETPTSVPTQAVPPGLYCHLDIKTNLERLLVSVSNTVNKVELFFGIDGLPLFKSNNGELWPIMMSILNIPNLVTKVVPVGIYYGRKKPNNNSSFLRSFVTEIKLLVEDGIIVSGKHFQIILKGFCCDAPAKSFILGTKGHTGYSSCTKCKQYGLYLKNRMCFPEIPEPEDMDLILRTSEGFIRREDKEFHIGTTILTDIPALNFVTGFPLDYMHLVCLGVTRTLINIWMFDKVPHKMPQLIIDNISSKLEQIKKWVPVEFCRQPRRLDDVKRWKATEFRQFLLYTGPVVLENTFSTLPNGHQIFDAFMCLHIGMRILLDKKYCILHNSYASGMLKRFVEVIKILYGTHYITHNFHGLLHLASEVSTYGPLDNCSAFKFENYLSKLKKHLRKSDKPLQQIVKRLQEQFHLSHETENKSTYPQFCIPHFAGPILEGCDSNLQFEKIKLNEVTTLELKTPNSCCKFIDGSIGLINNIIYSNQLQNFAVVYKKYKHYENYFSEPYCDSEILGIHVVKELQPNLEIKAVSEISEKLFMMPLPNEKDKYVVMPLLHSERV